MRTTREIISRHDMWRHITNTLAATIVILALSALTSWVLINWLAGCGEINPRTGYANTEVCILHPANWR
jgi:hypothetical protein